MCKYKINETMNEGNNDTVNTAMYNFVKLQAKEHVANENVMQRAKEMRNNAGIDNHSIPAWPGAGNHGSGGTAPAGASGAAPLWTPQRWAPWGAPLGGPPGGPLGEILGLQVKLKSKKIFLSCD